MKRAGRILGLDYGERRIGVAVSDPSLLLATGLTTIDTRRISDPLTAIGEIITEYGITAVVVGFPVNLDGLAGEKAKKVKKWADCLQKRFSLPVHLEDERYSSSRAAQNFVQRGKKLRRKNKADIDRIAACYILQAWLDTRTK